jgi:hypothetical protein
MAWQIILGVVLGIPMVLLPIAFVWYLNVSGLYQVIRESRSRRQKRATRIEKVTVAAK